MIGLSPTKWFVVSPPRSGTTSLCLMAEMLNILSRHAPVAEIDYIMNPKMPQFYKKQFLADTPVYRPSFIETVVSSDNHKFIYCDRSAESWVQSFENIRLHLVYTRFLNASELTRDQQIDRESLVELFNGKEYSRGMAIDAFISHRQKIINMIPPEKLLIYKFSMGWDPFCEFVGAVAPSDPVPHRNKTS